MQRNSTENSRGECDGVCERTDDSESIVGVVALAEVSPVAAIEKSPFCPKTSFGRAEFGECAHTPKMRCAIRAAFNVPCAPPHAHSLVTGENTVERVRARIHTHKEFEASIDRLG